MLSYQTRRLWPSWKGRPTAYHASLRICGNEREGCRDLRRGAESRCRDGNDEIAFDHARMVFLDFWLDDGFDGRRTYRSYSYDDDGRDLEVGRVKLDVGQKLEASWRTVEPVESVESK